MDRLTRYRPQRQRRSIVPDPLESWDEERRFLHEDIADLSDEKIAAEIAVLQRAVERRIFHNNDEPLWRARDLGPRTEIEWMVERGVALKREATARRTSQAQGRHRVA